MPAPRIVATFTGDPMTAFHEGIPAHDLTDRDWERLTPEQQQTVAASGVYELKPKEAKALAADADAPAEVGDSSPPAVAASVDPDQQAAPAADDAPARTSSKRA